MVILGYLWVLAITLPLLMAFMLKLLNLVLTVLFINGKILFACGFAGQLFKPLQQNAKKGRFCRS